MIDTDRRAGGSDGSVDRIPARQLLALALWLGALYGLIEAGALRALTVFPSTVTPLNGTTADILWFDPLFYAVVVLTIAAPLVAAASIIPRVPWDRVLVFLSAWGAIFLIADVKDHQLAGYAGALLAAGMSWRMAVWYGRHERPLRVKALRGVPALVVIMALLTASVIGGRWARERWLLRAASPDRLTSPNVLLLVMDTVRADHLGGYGYDRATTPRLDRLARSAVVFEQAHAASSWTLPSHGSMMTARLPHEHGAGELGRPFLDARFPTVAEAFSRAGYATGGFSANTYWAARHVGLARGFAHWEDYFRTSRDAVMRPVLGRRLGWELAPLVGLHRVTVPPRSDEMNNRLLAWLDRIGDRPFFAFVNYMDAHGPYLAPEPYASQFDGEADTVNRERGILSPTDDLQAERLRARTHMLSATYDGSIGYLDVTITDLIAALDQRGIGQRTVIIVTSDHGESFGEQGRVSHGNSVMLEQTHVPLVIRLPEGRDGGRREARPVSLQQLPATMLALAGQKASMPGRSMFDVAAAEDASVVTEVARREFVPNDWPSAHGWQRALVTSRWHFVLSESGERTLYDLPVDPHEEHNLAGIGEYAEMVGRFSASLAAR